MKARIVKRAGWLEYSVQTRVWYWPFWRVHERHHELGRAKEIARELVYPVIITAPERV